MAKTSPKTGELCSQLISRMRQGQFARCYLLMGEESYYPTLVCNEIISRCIAEEDRDFNQSILYGSETTVDSIISEAMRFPMMSPRQLVVVRDAQAVQNLDKLSSYCASPLDSTVLVLLFRSSKLDKRTALYKAISANGAVVESNPLRDYEIPSWISEHFSSRGLDIDPAAAQLLGEFCGTDLSTLSEQAEKLAKGLDDGKKSISISDIEQNIGISREYSVFELNRLLNSKDRVKALRTASIMGSGARFSLPAATAMLYSNFNKVLRYAIVLEKNPRPSPEQKAKALQGVNPYFWKDYDVAVRNYPKVKCMQAISLLCEYDYLGKGGSPVTQNELFTELISKILNL